MTPTIIPRAPARLPHAMTHEQEFDLQGEIADRAIGRMKELNALINGERLAAQLVLPLSGLHLVGTDGGALLFRGGRP